MWKLRKVDHEFVFTLLQPILSRNIILLTSCFWIIGHIRPMKKCLRWVLTTALRWIHTCSRWRINPPSRTYLPTLDRNLRPAVCRKPSLNGGSNYHFKFIPCTASKNAVIPGHLHDENYPDLIRDWWSPELLLLLFFIPDLLIIFSYLRSTKTLAIHRSK